MHCVTLVHTGVHVPLIIRAPFLSGVAGKRTDVLAGERLARQLVARHTVLVHHSLHSFRVSAELVDLYPTLGALAGLPDPRALGEAVNGTSLAPLFFNPHSECERNFGNMALPADNMANQTGLHQSKSDRERSCRTDYVAGGQLLKDAAFAQFAKTCAGYASWCTLDNLTYVCVTSPASSLQRTALFHI